MRGFIASRRTVIKATLTLGGIAVLSPVGLVTHGVTAQQATPGPAAIPAGETFVALADDGRTHVAVVIAPGDAGTDRGTRFYLCDGQTHNVWLMGATTADILELSSDTGQVRAALAASVVTGEATLPDGSTLTFEATRAEGVAGLYEVILHEGRLEGRGGDGQRLQGGIAGTLVNGRLVLVAVATLANDTIHALAAIATSDFQGASRWIVLPGGKPIGGPRIVQGVSQGSGLIDPLGDLAFPEEGDFFVNQNVDI